VTNFEDIFIRFDMIHERDRQTDIAWTMPSQDVYLSVCLSVRLSVTCRYSVETVILGGLN